MVTLKEKSLNLQRFKDIIDTTGSRTAPEWMDVDLENRSIKVNEIPTREAIDIPVNETLIVELYSK